MLAVKNCHSEQDKSLFLGANKVNPTMNQGKYSLKTEINLHFRFTGATLKFDESCKYLEPWKDSVSLVLGDGFHRYIQKSRYDARASQSLH